MDAVLHLAESLLTSPWLFALVAVLALFDSVLPIVPAETVVIAAAAYAATGNPNALLLIGSAWAGALLGDVAAHHLGPAGCVAGSSAARSSSGRRGNCATAAGC